MFIALIFIYFFSSYFPFLLTNSFLQVDGIITVILIQEYNREWGELKWFLLRKVHLFSIFIMRTNSTICFLARSFLLCNILLYSTNYNSFLLFLSQRQEFFGFYNTDRITLFSLPFLPPFPFLRHPYFPCILFNCHVFFFL